MDGNILRCGNYGKVSGCGKYTEKRTYRIYQGGIVGTSTRVNINDCYSTGNLGLVGDKTYNYIGGISGDASLCTISNCYFSTEITPVVDKKSGIVASSSSNTIDNCYYLKSSYQGIGTNSDSGTVVSKTSSQLKNITNTLNNISNVWVNDSSPNINDGYPILRWEVENVE